jgi:hypothetical protein
MDVIKISFCSTNQNPVALYHILDGPSVKLTLFQPPTVVSVSIMAQHLPRNVILIMGCVPSVKLLNGKRCGVLFRTLIGVYLALRHLLLGISVQFASHMTCFLRQQRPYAPTATPQRANDARKRRLCPSQPRRCLLPLLSLFFAHTHSFDPALINFSNFGPP